MIIYESDIQLLPHLQKVEGPSYTKVLWVDDVIYGSGGWNRYYINKYPDGEKKWDERELNEVTFSEFHSSKEGIEKAKAAGFRMHP
jgi:hypothetical protein